VNTNKYLSVQYSLQTAA